MPRRMSGRKSKGLGREAQREVNWDPKWSTTVSSNNPGLHPAHRCFFDRTHTYAKNDHGTITSLLPPGFDPSCVWRGTTFGTLSLTMSPKFTPHAACSPQRRRPVEIRRRPGYTDAGAEAGWDSAHQVSVSAANPQLHGHFRSWFDRPAEMGAGAPCTPAQSSRRIRKRAVLADGRPPWALGQQRAPARVRPHSAQVARLPVQAGSGWPVQRLDSAHDGAVLVASADELVRERVRSALEAQQFVVHSAGDYLEGLQMLRRSRYCSAFIDDELPGDGRKLTTEFRSWEQQHRVLVPRQTLVLLVNKTSRETLETYRLVDGVVPKGLLKSQLDQAFKTGLYRTFKYDYGMVS